MAKTDTPTVIDGNDPKSVQAAWANPATEAYMRQNYPETNPANQAKAAADTPAPGFVDTLKAGIVHGAYGFYNEPEQQFNQQYSAHPAANQIGQGLGSVPYVAGGTAGGAGLGAAIGAGLGVLGGPFAEITVPAGMAGGSAIGGVLGGAAGGGGYNYLRKKDILDEQHQPMTFQNTAPSVATGAILSAIPGGLGGSLLERTLLGAGMGYGSDVIQHAGQDIEQGKSPLHWSTLQPGLGTAMGAASPSAMALGQKGLNMAGQAALRAGTMVHESPMLAPFRAAPRDLGDQPPPGPQGLPPPGGGGGGGGGGGQPPLNPMSPTGLDTIEPDLRGRVSASATYPEGDDLGAAPRNITDAQTAREGGMVDTHPELYDLLTSGGITQATEQTGVLGRGNITQIDQIGIPPQGAQPGYMNMNVLQMLNPSFVKQQLAGPFKDKLLWALNTLRDATDTLGDNAKQQVAKAQMITAELTNEYQNPVIQAAKDGGYNGDPEIDNKINTLFGETQRGDIYNGKVDLNSYGIPAQLHTFVKLTDRTLHELITAIGFIGKGNYNFKKGFVNSRGTPTILWSPETGKAAVGIKDPNEFKYSAIFHHRKEEGPAPDDKNILQALITHTNKLIRQAAIQPFRALADEMGNPMVGADGNFIFVPDPSAPYTFFSNILNDKNSTESQKMAAQTVVDNMLNKPLNAVDRVIKRATSNFITSVLTQRATAGYKHYPTLFATSQVPMGALIKAGVDSVTNPTAIQLLNKYHLMTFKDIEQVKANILYKSKLGDEGADVFQALDHHHRSMAFLGSIYSSMQKTGITDLKTILNKTDPRADGIIQEAYAEVGRTHPNWSEFTGRPALQSSAVNLALVFKQSKLTEAEQVVHFIKLAKQGNLQPLGRYMVIKFLIGGPSNFISPQTANLILNSGAVTDPGMQQLLEDARDGTMAEKMIQSAIPDYNISVQKSIGTPLIAAEDLPGMEGDESALQKGVNAATTFTNPKEGATWQDKAVTGIRAVEPFVSAAVGSGNVGGVKVSPNLVSRMAVSGINATRPIESFAGHPMPIHLPSEALRASGLAAGNVDKDRLAQYDQDRHVLTNHLRNMVEAKKPFTQGEQVEFDRFFNNYKDVEAKKFDGKFKTESDLRNLVKNGIKSSIQDGDGRLKLSPTEWAKISGLIEQSRYYKHQGDTQKAMQFKTAFEQDQKELQKKYPYATTAYLMDKYTSSKQ